MGVRIEEIGSNLLENRRIAVVIPSYRAAKTILSVLDSLPEFIDDICVIDDLCPENSGRIVQESRHGQAPNVHVMFHPSNLGVGGATITGYRKAIELGSDIVFKIDADGQMDPSYMKKMAQMLISGECGYVKGNRFSSMSDVEPMPKLRVIGNAGLALFTKASTGYWNLLDSTNGYTAIPSALLKSLPLDKISKGYFFESDLLFRLGLRDVLVREVSMKAIYGVGKSSLSIGKTLLTFPLLHARNFVKRIIYLYYLRSWSMASFELPLGIILFTLGAFSGINWWTESSATGIPATTGQVFISGTMTILGVQLLLSFLNHDLWRTPR